MFEQLLFTIAIIARLSDSSLADALETAEDHYIVPTVTAAPAEASAQEHTDAFEWRIMPDLRTTAKPPLPKDKDRGPELQAKSALVMDVETQRILWQYYPDDQRSVASITKLMTALTWFDNQPTDGLNAVYTMSARENTIEGKELNLPLGEKLTTLNLLRSSIVGSDNDTALALAHSTPLTDDEFIQKMNRKAKAIGMTHTTFVDPTGLSDDNVSTAYDIALLAKHAFYNPQIQQPAQMKQHDQRTVESNMLTRVRTTNKLLYDPSVQIVGGKTGYTIQAGYCVVVQVREPTSKRDMIVVILGAPTDNGRFTEAKKLIEWTTQHYAWPTH